MHIHPVTLPPVIINECLWTPPPPRSSLLALLCCVQPIRCIHVQASKELCFHLAEYRILSPLSLPEDRRKIEKVTITTLHVHFLLIWGVVVLYMCGLSRALFHFVYCIYYACCWSQRACILCNDLVSCPGRSSFTRISRKWNRRVCKRASAVCNSCTLLLASLRTPRLRSCSCLTCGEGCNVMNPEC